jgi:hypothetical protein
VDFYQEERIAENSPVKLERKKWAGNKLKIS